MTSPQSRRSREGADIPSQTAATDALKRRPEIARPAECAGDPRTVKQERTAAAPPLDHLVRDAEGERNPRLTPFSPGAGCVRMSLLSAADLPVWPLSTGCEVWTWT